MSTTTLRLGLPRPTGSDFNNLANMQALVDAIDAAAAVQTTFAAHTHAHGALTGIDTDTSTAAIHHTIGLTGTQAAPGNHSHTGLVPAAHGTVHAAGGSDPLPANAITTALITDLNVTSAKIAAGAATGTKLGSDVVVLTGAQTISGLKRFQSGVLLDQIATPGSPGAGLTTLYSKADGNIYRRTTVGEFPLGGAREMLLHAKAWDTDQTPGTWAELVPVDLSGRNWVLAFAKGEKVETGVQVPYGYSGAAITAYIIWYGAATSGNALWRLQAANTAAGGNLSAGFATRFGDVADPAVASANQENAATLTWSSNLPAGGDWLQLRLLRPNEAGDTMTGDALVLGVALVFG
jgi:hypothetical protein